MKSKNMNSLKGSKQQAKKYYRWVRRYWFHAYWVRVRQTEVEIGGELHAC